MDTQDDVLIANRAMLVHFDSYSAALVFAKWGDTLLAPAPLPPSAAALAPTGGTAAIKDGDAVKAAVVARLGLNPAELELAVDFDHQVSTDAGPVRVHLLRFITFEAPKAALEAHGGVFRPISALRGGAPVELLLAREVFNLIIGAGGGRA